MRRYPGLNRARGEVMPLEERYQYMVAIQEDTDSCWLWKGKHRKPRQYPAFKIDGKHIQVHRWTYEHFVGPVPEGLLVDHLCNNNNCLNPWHLEPKTSLANTMRGSTPARRNAERTHCIHGHPFDEANTRYRKSYTSERLHRWCATCNLIHSREMKAKRRVSV